MNNKKSLEYTFGIILVLVSLFMLFKNTYVSSFGFYSFGRVNTGAILIVLLILAVIAAVVKPNKITKSCIGIVLGLLVLSLILGIRMGFRGMTVIDIILILVPLAIGVGLILKNIFAKK